MNRIALVEDHRRLATLLTKALRNAGIETDVFERIEPALLAATGHAYAVLVIDRGLPDGDGLDLVRQLRAAAIRTPCLMLTSRDALHDRVEGLESGADDYLTKPFSMDEFVARVRALMRRPAVLQSLTPEFGDIQVRPAEGCMTCGAALAAHPQPPLLPLTDSTWSVNCARPTMAMGTRVDVMPMIATDRRGELPKFRTHIYSACATGWVWFDTNHCQCCRPVDRI
jgi:CheY-like chemotaxis protein